MLEIGEKNFIFLLFFVLAEYVPFTVAYSNFIRSAICNRSNN